MAIYSIQNITELINGDLYSGAPEDATIKHLLLDSRSINAPATSLFFAIIGARHDGHQYIEELIQSGIRNFVVSKFDGHYHHLKANFILVPDCLKALQTLATAHRGHFVLPVVGITGSNGKTIVKEWLYQLLRPDKNIVRSPKSYNSQVGVPLSVWAMNEEHELALFEAGISQPGEMERLAKIIQPNIVIFTNIGEAHAAHFSSIQQKVQEKLKLAKGAKVLIYCKDYAVLHNEVMQSASLPKDIEILTWSRHSKADLQIGHVVVNKNETAIQGVFKNKFLEITIPFTDNASIENAIQCWALMLFLDCDNSTIKARMEQLSPVAMRLELKEGINNCSVINDSYNSDLGSLTIALDFLHQQKQHHKRTLVLSDILQSGKNEKQLYLEVATLLQQKQVDRLVAIGPALSRQKEMFPNAKEFYPSTDDFLSNFNGNMFKDETILLKGARAFYFEKINTVLQQKAHETVLEINLNALIHNLNYYRSILKPGTRIMAMVKAFSYGSGGFEIANVLQFHRLDYLAVAYADEGVALRKAGITMPIMVMSPEEYSFEAMLAYNLEPELYSFRILQLYAEAARRSIEPNKSQHFPIHIKMDTGMHRLGFDYEELNELIIRIKNYKFLKVQSVFSHLAGSDEAEHKEFTEHQIAIFAKMRQEMQDHFSHPFLAHILNSAGIKRFPQGQFDMVRLGIGLYGVAPDEEEQKQLQNISTLKTTISQIKNIPAGASIGYSRKGFATKPMQVATVAIGYADGLSRRLGNGNGHMLINGHLAPIVGNVCMDMCMLDITGINAQEGDEVIVFGKDISISEMAKAMGSIPYEVLTGISQRVKRVYYQE